MSVHIVEARATQQMPARRRAPKGCGPQAPEMISVGRPHLYCWYTSRSRPSTACGPAAKC